MNYNEYISKVKTGFLENSTINETTFFYESVFKWQWMATKLKLNSFVTYSKIITKDIIKDYSKTWFQYALKNHKGLPRGLQNCDIVYSVLASETIEKDAIEFVQKIPKKHYSAFECPVLVDLTNNRLLYYTGGIVWGMMYITYIRNYIETKFSL